MTVTFGAICSLLQSVEIVSTRQPRLMPKEEKDTIRDIIANWFDNQRQNLEDPDTNGGAVLSTLFPHRRKDRVYGLQAPLLAKKLANLLNFNHGQRALFDERRSARTGDLGACTERVMRPWDGTFSSKHAVSLERVDQLLIQLAAKYRFSDEAIRKKQIQDFDTDNELKNILTRLEAWEAKWLVRLILRDHCTIELDEKHTLKCYHFLLPDLLLFQDDFDAVFGILRNELSEYPSIPDPTKEADLRVAAAQRLMPIVGIKVGRPTFYKAWSFKHCFQMVDQRAWIAEVKYDGEFCQIHVDLEDAPHNIKIFSKNGKDATADRRALQPVIRSALRIGQPDCIFKTKCIVLGEMVVYSDKERKILPFHKIRKHVSRSGSFLGTWQDSLPHAWEHLMVVFFDVLMLDRKPVLRHCLQDRRRILRDLVHVVPGRSMRSEWTLLDFKTRDGLTDLKQVFARSLANRHEGLILKPLYAPYFPLLTDQGHRQAGFFIKVKKDYLSDMGGERDLGDFAVIGASFDPQVARKANFNPLHWTHFYLGCCINKTDVTCAGIRPKFKVVAMLSIDKCVTKTDAKYLNVQGYVRQVDLRQDGPVPPFDILKLNDSSRRMMVAFKIPFVAEVLGGGFEKASNEKFEMLRHPRVSKLHHDRTWDDCVTMADLERMAGEKWDIPTADKLDGHARDVALLVKKYVKQMGGSQCSISTCETTQDTTQQTTSRSSIEITPLRPQAVMLQSPSDSAVQGTQEDIYMNTWSSISSVKKSAQRRGAIRKVHGVSVLVRQDTCERLFEKMLPTPASTSRAVPEPSPSNIATIKHHPSFIDPIERRTMPLSNPKLTPKGLITLPTPTSEPATILPSGKRHSSTYLISPPTIKRRKTLTPLKSSAGNHPLGAFDYDSQEATIHIYAKAGLKVCVHSTSAEEE